MNPKDIRRLMSTPLKDLSLIDKTKAIHRTHKNKPVIIKPGDFLEQIYKDDSEKIVVKKSTQCGISEWLAAKAIHWACHSRNVLYILPTYSLKNQFVQERIDKTIMYTDLYKDYIDWEAAKLAESTSMKQFGSGTIVFSGSNTPIAFVSFPADKCIVDELDECAQEYIPMLEERQSASTDKSTIKVGNPTILNYGIDYEYGKSDRKQWWIKHRKEDGGCGKWISPDFFTHIIRQEDGHNIILDSDWDKISAPGPLPICQHCGKSFNRFQEGEWRATEISDVSGYHVSKMFSTQVTTKELVDRFAEGLANDTIMQRFYNGDLGLAFIAKGSKIDDMMIEGCICDYTMPDSSEGVLTVMGADVGTRIHVVINQVLEGGRRRSLFIGDVREEEDVVELYKKYNCRYGVIDALPETRVSKRLSQRFKGMFMCVYTTTLRDSVDQYKYLHVERTQAIDEVKEAFINQTLELPANIKSHPEFCDHVKSSTRVFDESRQTYKWVEASADHLLHAMVYALKAEKLIKLV